MAPIKDELRQLQNSLAETLQKLDALERRQNEQPTAAREDQIDDLRALVESLRGEVLEIRSRREGIDSGNEEKESDPFGLIGFLGLGRRKAETPDPETGDGSPSDPESTGGE